MTTKIRIQSDEDLSSTSAMIKSAISSEIFRLEMSLDLSHRGLDSFEKKYRVPSEKFISEMAAEDLDGGDEEYIRARNEFEFRFSAW